MAISASLAKPRRLPHGVLLGAMGLAILAVGAVVWRYAHSAETTASPTAFYTIVPMDLDVIIRKDGELQATTNLDVVCPVEGLNTIRTIVNEGSAAKKGDIIAELDSSDMKKKLQSALLDVQKAESDYAAAKVNVDLQKSKNTADIEAANVELKLAQIDLKAYTEGTYPQTLNAAKQDAEMAKITVQDNQQLLQDAKALQGKGFVTQSEVRKAEVELLKAQGELDKKQTDLRVLSDYTHEKDLADKENKVSQAEKKVQPTVAENESNLAEKTSDMQGKEQQLVLYKQTLDHTQEQVVACTIKAPGDGVVIYGSTAQTDFYRDTPIQPGGKIAEQQLLIRLPDTATMKVVAKIPEALAMKLRQGNEMKKFPVSVKIVGVPDPVAATVTNVAVLPDNSNRWWDPDRKEYPVDLTLAKTPANLKPGLTARVEITLEHLSNVLAAPLGTIYSEDDDTWVFVRQGNDIQPRKVTIGQTTETHAQLTDGISAGEEVVILEAGQGRQLLDKAGIAKKLPKAASAHAATAPTTEPTTSKT